MSSAPPLQIFMPSPEENAAAQEYGVALERLLARKVTLEDMRAVVDDFEAWRRANTISELRRTGTLYTPWVRECATALKLLQFIDQCIECREEVYTIFRARAHRQQRGSR